MAWAWAREASSSGWSSASGRRARRARRGSKRRRCARCRRRWRRRTPCPVSTAESANSLHAFDLGLERAKLARAASDRLEVLGFGGARGAHAAVLEVVGQQSCRARPRRRAALRRSAPAAQSAPRPRRHAARPARACGERDEQQRRRSGRIANYLRGLTVLHLTGESGRRAERHAVICQRPSFHTQMSV